MLRKSKASKKFIDIICHNCTNW